jgi:DNA-binding winged helix-turn-helix (wHTH) protein
MLIPDSPDTFRFGDFELDVGAYELRRNGSPVRIERQPMDLLLLLVERRRQLVLRSEIVERLWGKDVFVDVETGVHTAIRPTPPRSWRRFPARAIDSLQP